MNSRFYSLLIVLIIVVTVSCGFAIMNIKPITKATWIWNTQLIVSEREQIISFAKKHELNLIYLQIQREKVTTEQYRSFIRDAHTAGIKVHALAGDPAWSLEANRKSITQLVQWVHNYNRAVEPEERFSGIHLDVEPYLLPEWRDKRQQIVNQWMRNMEHFIVEAKVDQSLETGVDLPFWLDQVPTSENSNQIPLSLWMIQRMDHVTLMAYRNYAEGPDSILDTIKQEVEQADAAGKHIVVGVNIRQSKEGEHVSFYQTGVPDMYEQLSIVEKSLANHRSFGGYAVHDYDSWRNIK